MHRFLHTYKPFVRAGILSFLTYRFNFLCYVIGEILYCFIMFLCGGRSLRLQAKVHLWALP